MLENAFEKYRKNLKPSNEDKSKTWTKIENKLYKEKLSGNISSFRFKWKIGLIIFFLIVILPFGYTSYSLIKNYDIQLSKNIEYEQAEEGDMEDSIIEKSYEAKEHDDDIEKQEEQKSKDLKSYILIIGVVLIGLGIVGIIISLRKKKIKKFRKL
jgi:hypothetical protein